MIRSITHPGIADGSLIAFPRQATPYVLLAVTFSYTAAPGNNPVPMLTWGYGGVSTVAESYAPEVTTLTQRLGHTFAIGAADFQKALSGGSSVSTSRIPRIICTPEITLSLGALDANVGDAMENVHWLIDDEPVLRIS